MFLGRCCLRRGPSIPTSIGSAIVRRFMSSPGHDPATLPRIVVEKTNHFIEHCAPHAIPKYFLTTVLREGVPHPVRQETSEAVLNLLIAKQYFREVFQILHVLRGQDVQLSAPVRAKVLTVQFISNMVRLETYFHNMMRHFRHEEFSGDDAQRQLLSILYLLRSADDWMKHVERVVKLFLKTRDRDYRLDSLVIAFMVKGYLDEGHDAHAERWIFYHSLRPAPRNVEADPTFCFPYTALAHGRLLASPEKDPQDIYGPILDRMARDRAWPDTVFINVLITAELRHMHYSRAIGLYDTLCSHVSQGVYPDETTFSQFFAAAAHLTTVKSGRMRERFPVSPRTFFYKMAQIQLHLKKGHLTPVTPVITKASLGAALQAFIARKDFAAAIVVLKTFELLHIPLQQRIIGMVIDAIVSRCRQDLKPRRTESEAQLGPQSTKAKASWTHVFLDMRGIPKTRIMGISDWELRRRILSVARRVLAVAQREMRLASEELENEPLDDVSKTAEVTVEQSARAESIARSENGEKNIRTEECGGSDPTQEEHKSGSHVTDDSEESEKTPGKDVPTLHVREQIKMRRREFRSRLIDAMLSRALETNLFLRKPKDLVKSSLAAVITASKDMIPPITTVTRRTLKEMGEPHRRE